jgi:hypothetical protein
MNSISRFALFVGSLLILAGILWFAPFPAFNGGDLTADDKSRLAILASTLIVLSFAVLLLEHWFTKPTDALASAISAALAIAPARSTLTELGIWYFVYAAYLAVIVLSASLSIVLFASGQSASPWKAVAAKRLRDFSTTFGNSKVVYGLLFILTLTYYVSSQSPFFFSAMLYAVAIILIDPKALPSLFGRSSAEADTEIGEIIGVQSKRTILARLHANRPLVKRFDAVEFANPDGSGGAQKGIIIDNLVLDAQQWVKVLSGKFINDILGRDKVSNKLVAHKLNLIETEKTQEFLERFVGTAAEGSSILELKFEASGRIPVREGTLLQSDVEGCTVLYQVTDGVTAVKVLEHKNEAGLVVGHAAQVGTWNAADLKFDRFGWVPEMSTPIVLATDIEPVPVPPGEMPIGFIPGTNFPILLDKLAAVNCHTAILGVTGTGKSVFSRHLIRTFAADGIKVICVDFTGEYEQKFANDNPVSLVPAQVANGLFQTVDALQAEMAQFENQWNTMNIANWEQQLRNGFRQVIQNFFASQQNIGIFELPDVANSTAILSYTRWFFKVLFDMAKAGELPGQICVVLEEAHTVVPEWNFAGSEGKGSQALLNQIGQIALQGRKYGVGFLVIAQRTASVSKTVLTQCNTIIAFQQFDKTSGEFLSNYMSQPMVRALQNLPERHAIAVGKGFRNTLPTIFRVPEINEP